MTGLKPFKSDGCSVIGPIAHFFGYHNKQIASCCLKHDVAYWQGGPVRLKFAADRVFRECLVSSAELSPVVAWGMWLGVAVGGFIPHPNFRWGYGWPWPKYKEREW